MLKRLFYRLIWTICRIGMQLYFRGIEINGRKDLPKDGAIIYAPNHQNAFLDAIIIAMFSTKPVSFFTRGDIFRPPFLWFLDALNMLPVLRAKDGFSKVMENDHTFRKSVDLLLDKRPIMIFPEANHGYHYFLRTLSKGTARLAFDAQFKSDHPIYIVPVGLNFFRQHRPRYKLIINYGKAMNMKDYTEQYKEHKGRALSMIRNMMTENLKSVMIIPENDEYYETKVAILNRKNESLKFSELKEKVKRNLSEEVRTYDYFGPLISLFTLLNLPMIKLPELILSKLGDPVYGGSIKFATCVFFAPLWYTTIFVILSFFTSKSIAFLITIGLILTLFLRQELKRYAPES